MQLRRLVPVLLLLLVAGVPADSSAQSAWNSVHLTWTAPGDDSLAGNATQYDLRYSTSAITAANFSSATRVTGMPAPGASGAAESYTVAGLASGTTYWFAIKTADDVGNWSLISNIVSKVTASAPDTVRPAPAGVAVGSVTDSTALLSWNAVGDDSLAGTATSYDVRYSTSPITLANFSSATAATGEPTPAAPGTPQSMTVRGLSRQVTYYFALRTSDEVGNVSALSNVPSATTTDTALPASIRNLAASFVWVSWHIGSAPPLAMAEARRP
jgi:phosphodiesterase/alkaline phosphatase D-like protein